jgi:hypothetical protein
MLHFLYDSLHATLSSLRCNRSACLIVLELELLECYTQLVNLINWTTEYDSQKQQAQLGHNSVRAARALTRRTTARAKSACIKSNTGVQLRGCPGSKAVASQIRISFGKQAHTSAPQQHARTSPAATATATMHMHVGPRAAAATAAAPAHHRNGPPGRWRPPVGVLHGAGIFEEESHGLRIVQVKRVALPGKTGRQAAGDRLKRNGTPPLLLLVLLPPRCWRARLLTTHSPTYKPTPS